MTFKVDVEAMLRQAELVGEEMLHFRHGKDLYPYCEHCSNAAITPVTNVMGCKMGDDAEVSAFSNKQYEDQDEEAVEKCPGFLPKTDPEEVGFLNSASSHSGIMKKEIPSERVMRGHTSFETSEELDDQDKRYRQNYKPPYDLTGDLEKRAAQDDVPEVDSRASIEELYQMMDQAGIKNMNAGQRNQAVMDILRHWQNGLIVDRVTPALIEDTINEYLRK